MICVRHLTLPPSGDYAVTSVVRTDGGTGPAADLTGWTVSVVDVTGVLGGAVSASLPDPAAGAVRLAVTWQGSWPVVPGVLGGLRLRLTDGSDEIVTEAVTIYVAGPGVVLPVSRGSDMTLPFIWPDDRDGASLVGEVVDVVNASAALGPLVSVAVLDAATRSCSLHLEGDLGVALGFAGSFQLRRRTAGLAEPRTLSAIEVCFK